MFWMKYAEAMEQILAKVIQTQGETLENAAELCAQTIASGGLVHLFGSGHSSLAVAEMMPRTGAIVGFHPMTEFSLSCSMNVVGPMGHRQATFLEHIEGFGRVIVQNYALERSDLMILVSHSGLNPVVIDVALEMKLRGITVIGITSKEHNLCGRSRHSSGRVLWNLADVLLDTCVPYGDALVAIPNVAQNTGPASSVVAMFVINALKCEVAERLTRKGHIPVIMPNPNVDTRANEELMERFFEQYSKSVRRP